MVGRWDIGSYSRVNQEADWSRHLMLTNELLRKAVTLCGGDITDLEQPVWLVVVVIAYQAVLDNSQCIGQGYYTILETIKLESSRL